MTFYAGVRTNDLHACGNIELILVLRLVQEASRIPDLVLLNCGGVQTELISKQIDKFSGESEQVNVCSIMISHRFQALLLAISYFALSPHDLTRAIIYGRYENIGMVVDQELLVLPFVLLFSTRLDALLSKIPSHLLLRLLLEVLSPYLLLQILTLVLRTFPVCRTT